MPPAAQLIHYRCRSLLSVSGAVMSQDYLVEPWRSAQDRRHLRPDHGGQPCTRKLPPQRAERRGRHDRIADRVGTEDDDLHGAELVSGHSIDHKFTSAAKRGNSLALPNCSQVYSITPDSGSFSIPEPGAREFSQWRRDLP